MTKRKLTIIFAPNAETNLEQIEEYINENGNLKAAIRVVDQILDVCSGLQAMPRIGKARDDIASGLRSITAGSFVIYYRFDEQQVEILRIWHDHRDMTVLKKEF
jgi:toxin ParE1/3/4